MADSSSLHTITEEEVNFFCLVSLLINEGTTCVRRKFDEKVKDTTLSLAGLLKREEKRLQKYRQGQVSKSPRLLSDAQWNQLYPTDSKYAQNSKHFDLTLFSLLFNIFLRVDPPPLTKSWAPMPKDNDKSWQAEVVRLRYKRNHLYGHISEIGVSNSAYDSEFKEISDILVKLNVDDKTIRRWDKSNLSVPPTHDQIQLRRGELRELFETDLSDFQAFGQRVVDAVKAAMSKTETTTNKTLESLTNKITDLLQIVNRKGSQQMELTENVRKLCQLISTTPGSPLSLIKEIADNVHIELRSVCQGIDSLAQALHEQGKNVIQSLDEQSNKIDEQSKKIDALTQNLKPTKIADSIPKLCVLKPLIQAKDNEAFVVLILTPPVSTEDSTELGKALGRCPWNVIMDLDCETKTVGHIFDALSQTVGEHKNCTVRTFKETKETLLNDADRNAIATGQLTLYLQTLGCVIKRHCSDDKFREPVKNTVALLNDLLTRTQGKKQLVCMIVIRSSKTNTCIKTLIERLEFDCSGEKKGSHYVVIGVDTVDSLPDLNFLDDADYKDCKYNICGSTTENQISSFFIDAFGEQVERTFNVPGEKHDCKFSTRQMTFMSPCLELYHTEIGATEFENLKPMELRDKQTKIKSDYLHGVAITPPALYTNENDHVYVVRTEMLKILDKIKELIQQIAARTVKSDVFEITHDPSGGGTTCGRYLLYSLRKEYPCLEVKKIDDSLYTCLDEIYQATNKVCLMLVDVITVCTSDVVELKNRLSQMGIRFLIIHVRMVTQHADMKQSEPSNKHYLSSEIKDSKDIEAFGRLYTDNKDILNQTVFLFGLLAFCGDYERLERHIDRFMQPQSTDLQTTSADLQIRALRLCCIMSRYTPTHNRVKVDLLISLFSSDESRAERSKLQQLLGISKDFLIITNDSVRLAVAQKRVVDIFWKKLLPENQIEAYRLVVKDILIMIQKDDEEKEDSSELIFRLLKERDETGDPFWDKYSPIIQDLSKACGEIDVEKFLLQLLELIVSEPHNPHIRTVYARYLMYVLIRPDDSLKQMKLALGLQESDDVYRVKTTDSVLLSVYGNLCREKVTKHIAKLTSIKSADEMLKQAYTVTKEAIFVYNRAQQSTNSTFTNMNWLHYPLPFWAEAFARISYADLVFNHKCKNDYTAFHEYISSDSCEDDLLKGFAVAATKVLDELEYLKRNDRIYDNRPDITSNKTVQATFQMLRLQADGFDTTNDAKKLKFISRVPTTVPFNVGYVVRTVNGRAPLERWRAMTIPRLAFIIQEIDRRIGECIQLAANYKSMINAMIYIRKLGHDSEDLKKYNIAYAKGCADMWLKQFHEDIEGHLMRGILYIVDGLQKDDIQRVEDGKLSMKTCFALCAKRKAVQGYRRFRYAIGDGVGLEAVIPVEDTDDITKMSNLKKFTGRQIDNGKRVAIRVGVIESLLTANISDKTRLLASPNQDCLLKFNIVFAKAGLIAVNVDQERVI